MSLRLFCSGIGRRGLFDLRAYDKRIRCVDTYSGYVNGESAEIALNRAIFRCNRAIRNLKKMKINVNVPNIPPPSVARP